MFELVTLIWFAATIIGCVASLAALIVPRRRSELLASAGGAFTVAGVLGILSIGIVFVAAAIACFSTAERGRTRADRSESHFPTAAP